MAKLSAQPIYPTSARPGLSFSIQENRDPLQGQKLELSILCRDLKYADPSKSSSRAVIYMKEPGTQDWTEFDRTEVIKSEINPEFVHKFVIERYFEESAEYLKFAIFDVDHRNEDLTLEEPWGEAYCAIGDIASARGKLYEADLRMQSELRGKIIIRGEEPDSCKDVVFMSWEGKKLDKFFGKRYLFMVFRRCNEDNSYTVCLKTELAKEPNWNDIEVSVQTLCNGDEDRTIKVDIYESKDGKNQLLGTFDTRLGKLERGKCPQNVYQLTSRPKCELILTKFRKERQPTFRDYIQGGMQLSFVVAIDFTDSNGDPSCPESLHAIDLPQPNQYEMAIQAVGHVLQYYDSDKLFPAYGFGARLPPLNRISHKFPINFNHDNPSCKDVQGVMEAYKSCVRRVKLEGPTNFAPIIRYVSEQASRITDASEYIILLIITDGVYSDKDATMEALVEASKLPMSIIIVGVGDENFNDMIELDGDKVRVSYRGEEAERDIVQFVPLREHLNQDGIQITGQKRFNAKLLEEIPGQIIEYTKKRNLQPNPSPPEFSLH